MQLLGGLRVFADLLQLTKLCAAAEKLAVKHIMTLTPAKVCRHALPCIHCSSLCTMLPPIVQHAAAEAALADSCCLQGVWVTVHKR